MNNILLLKIFSFVLSGIAVTLIAIYATRKTKDILVSKIQTRRASFAKRERNRYVADYINLNFSKKLDEIYKYSRFYKTKIGERIQTSFDYFCITIVASVFGFLITLLWAKDFLSAVLMLLFVFIFFYGALLLMRAKNKAAVGKDIELFLQLLGNYSTNNTEIMSIFMQIAPQMREPLASCLIECVAEAQNIESQKIKALENLTNKIEHEKFKEIIYSLAVTEKYSGSFQGVVAFNKSSLQNFSKSQRKKRQTVQENGITLAIVIGVLMLTTAIMGQFVGGNVWDMLLNTTIGRIVCGIVGCSVGYFIFKLISFGA